MQAILGQKRRLKKMGVYRDKKGGQVLEAPKGGMDSN